MTDWLFLLCEQFTIQLYGYWVLHGISEAFVYRKTAMDKQDFGYLCLRWISHYSTGPDSPWFRNTIHAIRLCQSSQYAGWWWKHYRDVILGVMASQINSLNRLFRRKSKKRSKLRPTSLLRGTHRWPMKQILTHAPELNRIHIQVVSSLHCARLGLVCFFIYSYRGHATGFNHSL